LSLWQRRPVSLHGLIDDMGLTRDEFIDLL
jgi:hypothetical protein